LHPDRTHLHCLNNVANKLDIEWATKDPKIKKLREINRKDQNSSNSIIKLRNAFDNIQAFNEIDCLGITIPM
jgi:hypothetical protein